MAPARLVPPLARMRLLAMRTEVVLIVVQRARQVRRAQADGAGVGAAVALQHVVGDLQVAGVGVGEDAPTLHGLASFKFGSTVRLLGKPCWSPPWMVKPSMLALYGLHPNSPSSARM